MGKMSLIGDRKGIEGKRPHGSSLKRWSDQISEAVDTPIAHLKCNSRGCKQKIGVTQDHVNEVTRDIILKSEGTTNDS